MDTTWFETLAFCQWNSYLASVQIKNCIAFVADQMINLFNHRKTASNCFPLENLLGMNLYIGGRQKGDYAPHL